jgi:hypothetical protein
MPKHQIGPGDRVRVISDSAWTDADLLKAVERLAAEPRVQEEWLRSIGTWPMLDELALDFEYEFDRVRHGPDDALSLGALHALRELNSHLDEISGEQRAELWQPEALRGPEWRRACELAHRARAAMAVAR